MNIVASTGVKFPQYKLELKAGEPTTVDDEVGKALIAFDPALIKETQEAPAEVEESASKRKRGESSFEKQPKKGE